jgi:hypothetical protein
MPDLEPTATPSERPTLTQKRNPGSTSGAGLASSIPKIGAFDKPVRLQSSTQVQSEPEEGAKPKGSSARIVVWVVIVAALAVASYFALRNVLSGPGTGEELVEPTVTVTEDPLAMFVTEGIQMDEEAQNVQLESAYTTAAQKLGETNDGTFVLSDMKVTRYETFTRVEFYPVVDSGEVNMPEIMAEYASSPDAGDQIDLTFVNTVFGEEIALLAGEELIPESDTVSYVTGDISETIEGALAFTIGLSQSTTYVLHAGEGDVPIVYLDIKEVAALVSTTPGVSSTVAPTTSVLPTATALPGAAIYETSYSIEDQELRDGMTSNTASSGLFTEEPSKDRSFFWSQYSDAFYFYRAINKGDGGTKYPKVTAEYEGNKLIVLVSNLSSRTAYPNPNEPSTVGSASSYVDSYYVYQSGNVLRMEFEVGSQKPYRLSYEDFRGSTSVLVRIKN